MTAPTPGDGAWAPRDDLEAVTAYLRSLRAGATVLEITRGTAMSAVVVVPVLDQLMAEGTVRRRMVVTDRSGPRSTFVLTSAGRRRS